MDKCINCNEKLERVGVLMQDYPSNDYIEIYVCEYPDCIRYGLVTTVVGVGTYHNENPMLRLLPEKEEE